MIFGALAFLYLALYQSPPKVDPRPQEALGQVLADEAAKLLGSGGRLTLLAPDTSVFKNPTIDFQVKGFRQALKKSKLPLAATNLMQLDPLRLMRVPPGDFVDIMRKQSEADVIVSLLGPPLLSGDQRTKLGDKKPKIVALCSGVLARQVNFRELFEQNLLQVAIVSRLQPSAAPASSADPRAWFDAFYQVVTVTNVSELAPLTNSLAHDL